MLIRSKLMLLGVVGCLFVVVTATARTRLDRGDGPLLAGGLETLDPVVQQVNALFAENWRKSGNLTPANQASDLQVLRRLSLGLHGTVPSLQEIRRFEADLEPQRLERWTQTYLSDRRFSDYFAERLARGLVGTEGGQFVVFRRDRFVSWLSSQLQERVPYNVMVSHMISDHGLWTGNPPTNFITAAVNEGDVDENKLAGRTVRAFLGQRIDCAQCHDHPFAEWKQADFEGLAAFYGQVQPSVVGIEDKPGDYKVKDRKTLEDRVVEPCVPFHGEMLEESGTRRQRLAAWVTHPENRRFERAIANRVWGFVFGRPFLDPVDGIPNPPDPKEPDVLDVLGKDFREHQYDLRRLVQVIVASRPFLLDSASGTDDPAAIERLKTQWAVFPLVRLRPEQVIGSILQCTSIQTIDQNSHLVMRFIRFFNENDFIREYGDSGEDELQDQSGTIPQALLRMNGKLVQELGKTNPLSSLSRIASLSAADETCVDAVYLVGLTRYPSPAEKSHFLAQLKASAAGERGQYVEDLFWSIFNSLEFSWNH